MKSKSNERVTSNGQRTEYGGDSKVLYYKDLVDGGRSEGMNSPRRPPLFRSPNPASPNSKIQSHT